ncbi:MAG: hypothetical protein HZA81_00485 [Candidatus Taylorbacteria bacterium]|nr:hypothetical protein [Candidatus Taylorbacteria bacterium]
MNTVPTVLILENSPPWAELFSKVMPEGVSSVVASQAAASSGKFRFFKHSPVPEGKPEEVEVDIAKIDVVIMSYKTSIAAPKSAIDLIVHWRRAGFEKPIFIVTSRGEECIAELMKNGVYSSNTPVFSRDFDMATVMTAAVTHALSKKD